MQRAPVSAICMAIRSSSRAAARSHSSAAGDAAAGEFLDGRGEAVAAWATALSPATDFRKAHLPQAVRGRLEVRLDAPVLVAQRDFEVEHLLAVADEAERARFDDSRVDRADVHFMQRAPSIV